MKREIVYNSEARKKLLAGAKKAVDAVSVTLGPAGKCVLISHGEISGYGMQYDPIHVSKDGYTVARSIKLDDGLENVGSKIILEAAQKTVDQAGDGTTCTAILAEAIMREGMKLVDEGANSQELKKGIDKAVEYIVAELKRMAIPIGEGVDDIRRIAYVSANNDNEIADLISDAYSEIGNDAVIDIVDGKGAKSSLKVVDGFQFKRGWGETSFMFINNPAKGECELENPLILLYDRRLSKMNEVIPAMQIARQAQRPLLVISREIDGEALAFMGVNTANGSVKACAIKAPSFGDELMEMMEDIAALTGATFVTDLKGIGLESVNMDHLGSAQKVIVGKDNTVIIGGAKNKEAFEDLLNNLKMNLAQCEAEEQRQPIEARIARLMGSIAVISVGGTTETEMKERKDRCDDAVRATKSAIAEGYVAGGGISFLRIPPIQRVFGHSRPMQDVAFDMVLNVIKEPFKQICRNAGLDADKMLSEVELQTGDSGYNAKTGKAENLLESGIIDPVRVLRCALENAASVSGMALITETIICDTI